MIQEKLPDYIATINEVLNSLEGKQMSRVLHMTTRITMLLVNFLWMLFVSIIVSSLYGRDWPLVKE